MIANRWIEASTTVILLGIASGCSLLSIKSPEIPLTPREQEARLLTRDYAAHFAGNIAQLADAAASNAATESAPKVRQAALRLKLGAVTQMTRASTGLSPIGSLLDTWAFALQLRDFLSSGAGADLLGDGQPRVRDGAVKLAEEADGLARQVMGGDYPRYQTFVAGYVRLNPLESLDFARPSVIATWVAGERDKSPVRAVGTVAQALGDVSDRMRIYGERIPVLSLWQAQVALDRAGFDDATYRSALHDIDARLERISTLADTSPQLMHEAIAELRAGLLASSDRLDASSMRILRTLHTEREALAADIAAEREGMTAAFDAERARITDDAARITQQVVTTSWRELQKLVAEAMVLLILLALVLLGLPFAAGYLVGRRRQPPS